MRFDVVVISFTPIRPKTAIRLVDEWIDGSIAQNTVELDLRGQLDKWISLCSFVVEATSAPHSAMHSVNRNVTG